jgi:endonuclease I
MNMVKVSGIIGFILLSLNLFSQIPEGYYMTAQGLSGESLKTALYNIIKGHTEYPYTSTNTDVWDILKQTDKDTINTANVILFYTGESVNAAQEYNNGNGWTREHIWAKSRGDFGTAMGPGTDAHHIRPVDANTNSARNNRWFDNCSEPYLLNGVPTGCYTSSTSWVWQPRDKVKGDVARMIFYMATRYEGENGEPDLEVIDYIPVDNNTTEPIHAKLSALIQWNGEDPVDNYERNRNNVVYSYQHNRNPFVDHPEYINLIWDNTTNTNDIESNFKIIVYPNPVNHTLFISGLTGDAIASIYDFQGNLILSKQIIENQLDISNLKTGIYMIKIENKSGITTSRFIKL